jgi:hypothetical protein
LVEKNPANVGGVLSSELKAVQEHFRAENHGYIDAYHRDYWVLGAFIESPPKPLIALVVAIADHAAMSAARALRRDQWSAEWQKIHDEAEAVEKVQQCGLIREIFGNPFRRVSADPSWLTSDVLLLARGVYEDRAFDRMPILADALQDAGCDNANVLDHCRELGEHVCGCWVLDMLLGKG